MQIALIFYKCFTVNSKTLVIYILLLFLTPPPLVRWLINFSLPKIGNFILHIPSKSLHTQSEDFLFQSQRKKMEEIGAGT